MGGEPQRMKKPRYTGTLSRLRWLRQFKQRCLCNAFQVLHIDDAGLHCVQETIGDDGSNNMIAAVRTFWNVS
jgi:hypothetical protein